MHGFYTTHAQMHKAGQRTFKVGLNIYLNQIKLNRHGRFILKAN